MRILMIVVSLGLHLAVITWISPDMLASGARTDSKDMRVRLTMKAPPPRPETKRTPRPTRKLNRMNKPVIEEILPMEELAMVEPVEPAPVEPEHDHTMAQEEAGDDAQLRYIADVVAAVEKNKFYPLAARRRGLVGEARITVNINEDGSLADIKVECDQPLLARAAEDAVRKTAPLPRPNSRTVCPVCLVFKMSFKLN